MVEIKSLGCKAMLVKLTQSRPSLIKSEKQLSTALQSNEKDSSLIVLSKLFQSKGNPVKQVLGMLGDIYSTHRLMTLPYEDGGARLLPNSQYFAYTERMGTLKNKVEDWIRSNLPSYESYVQQDMDLRGARATRADYPSAEAFKASLSTTIVVKPLPSVEHFLFDISKEDKANFEAAMANALAVAEDDARDRVRKPLQKLIEKLTVYTGGERERFHTSLITNLAEGAEQSKTLSFDPPAQFVEALDNLKHFAENLEMRVDLLKDSEISRSEAKETLESVAAKLAAFGV